MGVRGQISIKILLILRLEPWPMLEIGLLVTSRASIIIVRLFFVVYLPTKQLWKKKGIFTPVSPLNLLKHRYNSFVSSHQVSVQLHFKAKRFFRRWFNFRVCFLTILTRSFQGSRDRRWVCWRGARWPIWCWSGFHLSNELSNERESLVKC